MRHPPNLHVYVLFRDLGMPQKTTSRQESSVWAADMLRQSQVHRESPNSFHGDQSSDFRRWLETTCMKES